MDERFVSLEIAAVTDTVRLLLKLLKYPIERKTLQNNPTNPLQ